MIEESLTGLPIVKENNQFTGLITIKDLSKSMIHENGINLETSYKNIIDVVEGEKVLCFEDEIEGKIIAAAFRSTTFLDNVNLTNDDILIVGDRHSIIEYAIESKVKLLIIPLLQNRPCQLRT